MRLAGLVIGPAILALLIVMGAARLSSALSEPITEPPTQASGLVWDGRVFTTRAAFAKWLEARGLSIRGWERKHPGSPWSTAKPTQAASASERQDVAPRSERVSDWFVLALGGVAALLVGLAGAAVLRAQRTATPRRVVARPVPVARPARPTPTNGTKPVTAQRPPLAVASLAVRRGVESARPRVHTAGVAARRGLEVARPRLQSAGVTARHGVGTAVAQTSELRHELRYAIATERFRVAFFYILAALFSVVIGLATTILI